MPQIYCIEGYWDYGGHEPSVLPMLEAARTQQPSWEITRRNCATTSELIFWLNQEWSECTAGSILYLATHGSPGCVTLSDGHDVCLEQLAMYLKETWRNGRSCLVHFSGCSVMATDLDRIGHFIRETRASAVSGYTEDVGWLDRETPALSLEMEMFGRITPYDMTHISSRHERLVTLREELQRRWDECGFKLFTRREEAQWDRPRTEST